MVASPGCRILHSFMSLRYNCRNSGLETVTMTRFLFFVLVERHRVVAPTSVRPLAAAVPALQI